MATKLRRLGTRTVAGALVASAPVIAACSTGPTYEQWAETDGAAGRINLDEVQEAFKKSESPTEFEKRVNEIYEGDGLVLIRAKQEDTGLLVVEGWEDLSNPANHTIDETSDDLLFSIVQGDRDHNINGHGANSYYRGGFGGGGFLFGYLLASSFGPRSGYYYSTPRGYARGTLTRQRTTYRNSSRYRSQVSKNSKYFSRQKSFAGSRYNQAGRSQSTARRSYQSRAQSSGSFKTSSTGVRSSWGASNRGSRGGFRGGRGGFRGGGGGQVIVGPTRP